MLRLGTHQRLGALTFTAILGLLAPLGCVGDSEGAGEDTALPGEQATQAGPEEQRSALSPHGDDSAPRKAADAASATTVARDRFVRSLQDGEDAALEGSPDSVPVENEPGAVIASDGEIASVLWTFHRAEVTYGQQACQHMQIPEASAFAEALAAHHIQAFFLQGMTFQQNAIPVVSSRQTEAFIDAIDILFWKVRSATPEQYDIAYVEAQIAAHTKLLDLIDAELMAAVSVDALRAELSAVRWATAHHLTQAEQLHDQLKGMVEEPSGG
ncbi:DUF4142 domain-containing protein [Chondromyces crocatus]|uniref:DUF4142 domain-containing protein n=1 Tax=Chondromyces crocatus TaxID=52 RepID=A0A0K1EPN5_CHOCO|nr:DUF4142 domain-containing protein [Chondromyces crocatus]AKT42821.1 uncharacterized protein CMC5_070490 [Chondromyces crocatus]